MFVCCTDHLVNDRCLTHCFQLCVLLTVVYLQTFIWLVILMLLYQATIILYFLNFVLCHLDNKKTYGSICRFMKCYSVVCVETNCTRQLGQPIILQISSTEHLWESHLQLVRARRVPDTHYNNIIVHVLSQMLAIPHPTSTIRSKGNDTHTAS